MEKSARPIYTALSKMRARSVCKCHNLYFLGLGWSRQGRRQSRVKPEGPLVGHQKGYVALCSSILSLFICLFIFFAIVLSTDA